MSGERRYRIHGFLEVRSGYDLDRLDPFRVDRIDSPDIVVGAYRNGEPEGERFGDYVWESDRRLTLDLGPGIRASLHRTGDRFEFTYTKQFFRVGAPEELIQALLTQALPSRGPHLLNAAGVRDPDGRGMLLFGPPQSGKTTTAVQLARRDGWSLLSDEIVFVRDGTVYGLARPVRFRRDSPLYDEERGAARRLLNGWYRSAIPEGTRRILGHLKHRVPGVNVGGTVLAAGELAPVADRASLSTCVFLRPTDDECGLESVDPAAAARSAALLSNWISDHPFLNRYAYLDSGAEYEIPATGSEEIAPSLTDCDLYAASAPRDAFTSLLGDVPLAPEAKHP